MNNGTQVNLTCTSSASPTAKYTVLYSCHCLTFLKVEIWNKTVRHGKIKLGREGQFCVYVEK